MYKENKKETSMRAFVRFTLPRCSETGSELLREEGAESVQKTIDFRFLTLVPLTLLERTEAIAER
jgi:hypothetical protein